MSATNEAQPIILVRGFGGLGVEDERRIAYQGFNDGSVYPQKRGENYIYEGLILRFMKSNWKYEDATNVVGYYENRSGPVTDVDSMKGRPYYNELKVLEKEGYFDEDSVVVDAAMARLLLERTGDIRRTLWVFRYYDLQRNFGLYAKALVKLIAFIQRLAELKHQTRPKVNIIAHSMGGLVVREAIQTVYDTQTAAQDAINKIVTLGTPHRGIAFQVLRGWVGLDASAELDRFNPHFQDDEKDARSYKNFANKFDTKRMLCVVGTNYKTYDVRISTIANRLFSVAGEFGMNYNRSDGLVKQTSAQMPGAPRTFVHKCHGGFDSLVTSREAFEIASRFFFGNTYARLRLVKAEVTRGLDRFGKSEIFFGASIKPRRVDFDLFHQSPEAENCYGPFSTVDLSDKPEFEWAGPDKLIWEGWLDTTSILKDDSITKKDMVFRVDFYVGERDLYGIGFSDNVIFRKQYYIRALLNDQGALTELWRHADEKFQQTGADDQKMERKNGGWEFNIGGTGFTATLRIELGTA
jgi:hypothetical protein